MTTSSWDSARHLLCVRLDSFGDVLMTGPAMEALREAVPGRTITLLTSPSGAAAARMLPAVDEVIVHDAPWMKHSAERTDGARDRAFVMELAERGFDAACIFTVYSQTPFPAAHTCLLADVPLRLAHARENAYQLLTHRVPELEPAGGVRHEVQRQLDLVATVGASADPRPIRVAIRNVDRASTAAALHERGIHLHAPLVVVHPGASAPSRRYAPASFGAAAHDIAAAGAQVLVVGGDADRDVVEAVLAAVSGELASWVGGLDAGQLAALLEHADVVVANNSGPAHLAAAVGTPVVSLYAMTNPQHTPWMVPHDVLQHDVPCRWCYSSSCPELHHRCLTGVAPTQVVDAALNRLRALGREPTMRDGTDRTSSPPAPTASVAATR